MDIADGKATIAYGRSHSAEWGLKTNKIGIMGFSAGGTVTAGVTMTYDAQSCPDFSAPIYPYVGSFGNHGFGMRQQNIPTDTWIDRFHEWLTSL